jgi:hypothetical protein
MAGTSDRSDSHTRAPFTASEQRDRTVKAEIEKERAATDAKTARLRALRLAHEEEERAKAAANPKPAEKPKRGARKKS